MIVPNMPYLLRLYCKPCDEQHWFARNRATGVYHGAVAGCRNPAGIHPGTVVALYSDYDGKVMFPSHVLAEPEGDEDGR